MSRSLISVRDLSVQFRTDEGLVTAVDGTSFELRDGEILGLVGESGSGKSVTAKSLMLLNPGNTVYGPESRIIMRGGECGSARGSAPLGPCSPAGDRE